MKHGYDTAWVGWFETETQLNFNISISTLMYEYISKKLKFKLIMRNAISRVVIG
jgi:hypothetical protein